MTLLDVPAKLWRLLTFWRGREHPAERTARERKHLEEDVYVKFLSGRHSSYDTFIPNPDADQGLRRTSWR